MKIAIISNDGVFCRMLELELCSYGAKTETGISVNIADANLIIFDAAVYDEYDIAANLPENCEAILFGYPDEISKIPAGILALFYVLPRPFLISDFIGIIFGSTAEEPGKYTINKNLKRKKSAADGIILNRDNRTAYYKGEPVGLTHKEFELLSYLIDQKGKTVSRSDVYDRVWGQDYAGGTNIVDVYVRYLRAKIDEHFNIKLIDSVRGIGYTIKTE